MQIKALEYKYFNHIPFSKIEKKYNTYSSKKTVNLTEDEFKSILSNLFTIKYLFPEFAGQINLKGFQMLNHVYFSSNITIEFGWLMIENLDRSYLNWYNELLNNSYDISNILLDNELHDFVEQALIDYMAYRKIEYGKFFLQRYTKVILDVNNIFNYEKIKKRIENTPKPLKLIADNIKMVNPDLSVDEYLFLMFIIKNAILKSDNAAIDYAFVNSIVKNDFFKIDNNREIYRVTINKTLNMNWEINKGRGGHKL